MHDLTETKSGNLATWATDINHHHQQACLRAGEAINHAIEAGKLLMRVKARLPHGEFGGWLGKNLEVTDRQARRYMAAAQGKPVPARVIASNRTPVSVLGVIQDGAPQADQDERDNAAAAKFIKGLGLTNSEMAAVYTELAAKEHELVAFILDAADPKKAMTDKNKQLRAERFTLIERLTGLENELAEVEKLAKSRLWRIQQLEQKALNE